MTTHPLSRQLEGKVAFVTGAGRGIGRGIAMVLAERGASVCVADLDEAAAARVASEVAGSGVRAMSTGIDVTSPDSVSSAVQGALREYRRIDILVANAGVIGGKGFESRARYVEDDWDATFKVNVMGAVHTADAVIPQMKERGAGRIIVISSQGGRAPRGVRLNAWTTTPYLVSKAAAIQYTHALAIELAQYNITVNAVCPGLLWTPMFERITANNIETDPAFKGKSQREIFDASVKARVPLGRPQTPEDVGRAVAFLASDDASEITGQALNVNGGAVMS